MDHGHTGVGVDADGFRGFRDGGGRARTVRCRHTAHLSGEPLQ